MDSVPHALLMCPFDVITPNGCRALADCAEGGSTFFPEWAGEGDAAPLLRPSVLDCGIVVEQTVTIAGIAAPLVGRIAAPGGWRNIADLRAGDAVIVWTLPDGQPTAATLDADPAEGPAQPWPPVSGSLLLLGVDKIIAVEL